MRVSRLTRSSCLPRSDNSCNTGAACESNTSLIPASPPDVTHLEKLRRSSEAASWSATLVKYALGFLDEAAHNFGGRFGGRCLDLPSLHASLPPSLLRLLQPTAKPPTWRQAGASFCSYPSITTSYLLIKAAEMDVPLELSADEASPLEGGDNGSLSRVWERESEPCVREGEWVVWGHGADKCASDPHWSSRCRGEQQLWWPMEDSEIKTNRLRRELRSLWFTVFIDAVREDWNCAQS